jgi:hypothetical protein
MNSLGFNEAAPFHVPKVAISPTGENAVHWK